MEPVERNLSQNSPVYQLAIPGQVAVGLIQPALGLYWPWSGAPNENIVQNP